MAVNTAQARAILANVEHTPPTSSVYPRSEGLEWYEMGLLIPHEPIRADMIAIADAMESGVFNPIDRPWQLTNFFRYFKDYFEVFVHHHHDAEEQTKAEVPAKVTSDHKMLMALLQDIRNCEEPIKQAMQAGNDAKVEEHWNTLKATFLRAKQEMFAHLQEEEEIIPTLLKNNFKREEEDPIVQRIAQSLNGEGGKMMMCWIFYRVKIWAPAEFWEQFIAVLPGPLVWIMMRFWMPRYFSNCKPLIDSLSSTRPVIVPEAGAECRCTIM